jgi:hypothetical protein
MTRQSSDCIGSWAPHPFLLKTCTGSEDAAACGTSVSNRNQTNGRNKATLPKPPHTCHAQIQERRGKSVVGGVGHEPDADSASDHQRDRRWMAFEVLAPAQPRAQLQKSPVPPAVETDIRNNAALQPGEMLSLYLCAIHASCTFSIFACWVFPPWFPASPMRCDHHLPCIDPGQRARANKDRRKTHWQHTQAAVNSHPCVRDLPSRETLRRG